MSADQEETPVIHIAGLVITMTRDILTRLRITRATLEQFVFTIST